MRKSDVFYRTAHFEIKAVVSSREQIAKFSERTANKVVTDIDPNYLYVVISGLHGDDPNQNGDFFWWEQELLRKLPAPGMITKTGKRKVEFVFQTWIDKPNLVNHDANIVVGEILDTWPVSAEKSVDMLVRVNRKNAELCKGIESGEIQDVSMGCIVGHSYCSICGNRAEDESQWCAHLHPAKLNLKGKKYGGEDGKIYASKMGSMCYEDNRDVTGIEVSWITLGEGADPLAERKVILARKNEGEAMPNIARHRLSAAEHVARQSEVRELDPSRKRSQASAGGVAESSPEGGALKAAFDHYIEKFGSAEEKAKFLGRAAGPAFDSASAVIAAINDGFSKKTAAVEACVALGLVEEADVDELTTSKAMAILTKAAAVETPVKDEHDQVLDEVIKNGNQVVKAQAGDASVPNQINVDSGDQALGKPEHEETPKVSPRKPTDDIKEKVTDKGNEEVKHITDDDTGKTELPFVKSTKGKVPVTKGKKQVKADDVHPDAKSGDQAITKVEHEDTPKVSPRKPVDDIKEKVKDNEFKITDSDTKKTDIPFVKALKAACVAYAKSGLSASDMASLRQAFKSTDYATVIFTDIQKHCKTWDDLKQNWPEIHAMVKNATDGSASNPKSIDVGDEAITKVEHEETPKVSPRAPNKPIDEQTGKNDYKPGTGKTDLPVVKAQSRCAKHDKCAARIKHGAKHCETCKERMAVKKSYAARFEMDKADPSASAWVISHGDQDIFKIVANKAIKDLKSYDIPVVDEKGKQTGTLKGLAAFGSQQYKQALLEGLNAMGAQKLVEQEFGGAERGFVEVLAQALPGDFTAGPQPGRVEAPPMVDEVAPAANLDLDLEQELEEPEEEQSSILDTLAEMLAEIISDNPERSVEEVIGELKGTFQSEDSVSEFQGMLDEKVKDKSEEKESEKKTKLEKDTEETEEEEEGESEEEEEEEEGEGEEKGEKEEEEGPPMGGVGETMASLKNFKRTVEASLPSVEARLATLEKENAELKTNIMHTESNERIRARSVKAGRALASLVEVGYLTDAEAEQKAEELAKLDDKAFDREIGHMIEVAAKLPKIASKEAPRVVTASIPHPSQEEIGIGLEGDGTSGGSRKSYADMWSRPGVGQ